MFGALFAGLGGILGLARIVAIAAPLLYVFYTINNYHSQGITIAEQKQEIASLKKKVEAWEGRYTRIDTKRGEYKLALDKYDEAARAVNCYAKVQAQLKLLLDTKWKDDALKGGG